MDFDHRSKHSAKFHQDLFKKRKHIRCEVVGAPKTPFVAARKIQKSAETETDTVSVPPEQKEADGPSVAEKPTQEANVMASSISNVNVQCNTSDNKGASSSSSAQGGYSLPFYTGGPCQEFISEPQILSHSFEEPQILSLRILRP